MRVLALQHRRAAGEVRFRVGAAHRSGALPPSIADRSRKDVPPAGYPVAPADLALAGCHPAGPVGPAVLVGPVGPVDPVDPVVLVGPVDLVGPVGLVVLVGPVVLVFLVDPVVLVGLVDPVGSAAHALADR